MNYQQILENIYQEIQPFAGIGKQADYIPALAKSRPGSVWHLHQYHSRRNFHAGTS